MSQLLDHPVPTLPPPPPRKWRRMEKLKGTRRTRRIVLLVLAGLFFFGMWLFYFSSVFALQSVVVEGVRMVTPAEVGQRADLGAGTPLARVNPEEVEARVAGIPAVRSVQVVRRWPNTVVIKVTERRQVGYVKDSELAPPAEGATAVEGEQPAEGAEQQTNADTGQPIYRILDETGYAFQTAPNLDEIPKGLPQIIAPAGAASDAAAQVAGSLPEDLLNKILTITAETPDDVTLTTEDQIVIKWGRSDQNDLKARILAVLIKKADGYWFDLRNPRAPTTAYSSPIPAPPKPSASASASEGDGSEGTDSGETSAESSPYSQGQVESIPSLPGVVPSTLGPTP